MEEIKIEGKNYYSRWSEGREYITDFLSLDRGAIEMGKNSDIEITEYDIKLDTTFKEFSNAMNRLHEHLEEFIERWVSIIREVRKLPISSTTGEKKTEIRDLMEEKEETVNLAKKVLRWVEDLIEKGFKAESVESDFPFNDLKELIQKLTDGEPRRAFEIKIKI